MLDWSFLLMSAATVVLLLQYLMFWAPTFPVYCDTLAMVGLIILGTKVLLRPGLLAGVLNRGPRRWRAVLVVGVIYAAFFGVILLLTFNILSGWLFYP